MPTHCEALPILQQDTAERISIEHLPDPNVNEFGLPLYDTRGGLLIQCNLITVRDCFACPRM
jgi:hypothetical protein